MMTTTIALAILINGQEYFNFARQNRKLEDLSAQEIEQLSEAKGEAIRLLEQGIWYQASRCVDSWTDIAQQDDGLCWIWYQIGLFSGQNEKCFVYGRAPYEREELSANSRNPISITSRIQYSRALAAFDEPEQAAQVADFKTFLGSKNYENLWISQEFIKGTQDSILRDTTLVFANLHSSEPKLCLAALDIALKKNVDDPELNYIAGRHRTVQYPAQALMHMNKATKSTVVWLSSEAKRRVKELEWRIKKDGGVVNPPSPHPL